MYGGCYAKRKMKPVLCERCGGKIPRFTDEPKVILGSFANISRGCAKKQIGQYNRREWWSQSRQSVVSYRLCDNCAERLTELLDGFVHVKE